MERMAAKKTRWKKVTNAQRKGKLDQRSRGGSPSNGGGGGKREIFKSADGIEIVRELNLRGGGGAYLRLHRLFAGSGGGRSLLLFIQLEIQDEGGLQPRRKKRGKTMSS